MTGTPPLVTIFGSLHYDIIVHGPARPRKGETVTGHAWYPACGGKGGNQAVSAARAGVRSAMIGAVADDDFGRTLIANLVAKGVDARFVRQSSGISTGMSVALFDSDGDYGAVIVSGSNLTLSAADVAAAGALFSEPRWLVLQNEVPDAANTAAACAMKAVGGHVLLNAAPARALSGALTALIDILVVNAIEAEQLAKVREVASLDDALEAARILSGTFPTAIVTAGSHGVAAVDEMGEEIAIEGVKVEVVSTHGAGDAFIGVLAAKLALGRPLAEALRHANEAAAFLVSGG